MVNLKATLVDGSYHPVDSSEMAFKVAANLAYKAGMEAANPVLLEPIGNLKVLIPDSMMGDIIGDINKRRGRILGMNPVAGGLQEVEADVPMAEMGSYAVDLRSMTQGRGSFTLEFARYEEAPPKRSSRRPPQRRKSKQRETKPPDFCKAALCRPWSGPAGPAQTGRRKGGQGLPPCRSLKGARSTDAAPCGAEKSGGGKIAGETAF